MTLKDSLLVMMCALFLGACGPAMAKGDLAEALRLSAADDWAAALDKAAGEGAVARDIIEWQRLRAGDGALTDYEDFLKRHLDWPGLELLQEAGEGCCCGRG